jgi:amidophosphoribosyltransferase
MCGVVGIVSKSAVNQALYDALTVPQHRGQDAAPVRHPNVYGIERPYTAELIAHRRSTSEVERKIGADWLVYQDLEDLKDGISAGNPALTDFDRSVFDGRYVTADIDQADIDRLAATRRGGPTARIACPPVDENGRTLKGLHTYH